MPWISFEPRVRVAVFDLGFRGTGTGVGCVDVCGRRKLAGLNIEAAAVSPSSGRMRSSSSTAEQ